MVPWRRLNGQTWWSLGLICLASFLVMGDAAFAANTKKSASDLGPTMRFVIVRSSAPGCEPTCPEWISAEGSIEAGTPALFKRTLKALGGRKLPLVVDSPGGNVDAALALGRLIRKNKLDIAVGKTQFVGCLPDVKNCKENDGKGARYFGSPYAGGAICNSACPLMFAGGIRRVVGQWAYLGVHQITTTYIRTKLQYRTTYRVVRGKKKVLSKKIVSRKNAGSYKTYEMSKATEKRLAAYLKEMGVGRDVLETMKNTPASSIQQLAPYDMLQANLVTSLDSVDLLTAATLCKTDPVAANCREIPAPADKATKPAGDAMAYAKPAPAASAEPEAVRRDDVKDMRFVLVRGRSFLCDPNCPEWISAEGTISTQTPERLRQLLDTIGDRRLPVVVNSPGGDVLGALATGRLIRERKLDVAVARTDFIGCEPDKADCTAEDGVYVGLTIDASGECGAACPIMLAGGVRRLVGPRAQVTVHSMGLEQRVKSYLRDMAVGPGLLAAMRSVPDSRHRQLEPAMMLKVGLTTGLESVDEFTGPTICKLEPMPENCRMVSTSEVQADTPVKL
ncbi:hypothetical protein [Mesorhizobium sp.]|uniref:COG3904 family protein n=1 Tax=Mesorhizobium sp. TaxID=1871066 RepID=UPI00121AD8F8|nr:hypothetical protein [Mesorhizobium sp.]TIO04445.1 MAG: hypothetical protein E5X88_31900 [Mesorhizobium sp.]TIO36851.1 MAG: hypothetical protein E5X89_02335 [Mesorhizobium sp.]TIP07649.1 MAG: hypothetical protein E5X73_35810 [Mesorhizobium sp.]